MERQKFLNACDYLVYVLACMYSAKSNGAIHKYVILPCFLLINYIHAYQHPVLHHLLYYINNNEIGNHNDH
jgi:hypothetical protein